jgi:uncharacterized Zn finger protein
MSIYNYWINDSPYDDIDWEDYGVACPECGNSVFDEIETEHYNEILLICVDCGHEFIYDIEEEIDE